jgi:hypothetical protein
MKSLAPLAAGLVVFGVVVWQTISRDMTIGPWLLAVFLVGHGCVHLMYVTPQPAPKSAPAGGTEFPFDLGQSSLLSALGVRVGALRAIGLMLIGMTVVGYLLAGLATVGLVIPADWWAGLVLASTAASVALLGLFFQPELVLGVGIDAVLLWVVLAGAWIPATTP